MAINAKEGNDVYTNLIISVMNARKEKKEVSKAI
jgi:hypothetical protein